ncbi:hypothetical protein Acr_07g0011580 [Actinidia rufa]|uniref:ABC-2 type transporter transmembrane domain-containing protein n=1 Tax=Actinidia rufa TaxID=165716 RepID=A0A7J0EX37_9ERIC|nr:hypothetical protein Acr_07g0011580 [Actinidia rufa]
MLLDHLIILARGQLMYQGSPKDASLNLGRMGCKVPKGENSIEFLIDVRKEYDQSELGVEPLAEFALAGMKPPPLADNEMSIMTVLPSPIPSHHTRYTGFYTFPAAEQLPNEDLTEVNHPIQQYCTHTQLHIATKKNSEPTKFITDLVFQHLFMPILRSSSPGYYTYSKEILRHSSTPTPHSSDYTVNEDDYMTPNVAPTKARNHLGPKSVNSFFFDIWILMRRNYKSIHRTPELFLSRLMVLTIMGFMMATTFMSPKRYLQGITNRLSFFIFTVCSSFFLQMTLSQLSFKSALSLSARLIPTEPLHIPYLVSLLTSFLLLFRLDSMLVFVWFALKLCGSILYFLIVLYASLLSTNSFVVFVSSVVPNFILGYAAVIAFTALFF